MKLQKMTLLEAIQQRHSVRNYTMQPIEAEKLTHLQAFIDEYNQQSGLHIQMITGDSKAFDMALTHYGKYQNITNYFAMIGKKSDKLDETVGYFGEKLVLETQRIGLNTCWVGLTFKKNPTVMTIAEGEKLVCVIAFGYGATQGTTHKIKTIEQVSKVEGDMPDWFRAGVEAALLAPTAINQQKFTFILKGNKCVETKAGWGPYSKVDLGIVKCHFEIGANTDFHFV